MNENSQTSKGDGWLEASGLPHIFRTLGLAIQPSKLAIALLAIVATLALGWALDRIWLASDAGVSADALSAFVGARQYGASFEEEGAGDEGIFKTFLDHEKRCVVGILRAVVPGASLAELWFGLTAGVYGVWWLVQFHPCYAALLGLGALLIWSSAGGAICRLAALQFSRDERPPVGEICRFVRRHLWGGFVLAPCIPIIFILVTAFFLVLGGMLLRVPVFGDLVSGLAFVLAIFGGFVITLLLVGVTVGGGLFWPAIAVEGSDAFDSFSRSLSYPFTKPWKTVLYAVLATVYASVCWLVVNLFTLYMLKITRAVVAFGTSPFGWWNRGTEEEPVSKLALLWPVPHPGTLYDWPQWSGLVWYEYISAFFIGASVLLAIGLMWSFLVSFGFSGGTVVYFLLRRDVDGIELDDVFEEDADEGTADAEAPAAPAISGAAPASPPDASSGSDESPLPGASADSDEATPPTDTCEAPPDVPGSDTQSDAPGDKEP